MAVVIHPLVDVAKRFAIDWLDRADETVPPSIMTPGYRVHIGETELDGLEAYAVGTVGQLRQFPGLALTVHELVTDGDRLALVFTEHGAFAKTGAVAAWAGVALFRWDGTRLTENWTQEDYYARRRQLAGTMPDVIRPPAAAPWTTLPVQASARAEATARDWLAAPTFEKIALDDGLFAPAVSVASVEVLELFSAGEKVAFAATWTGDYDGGLDDAPDARSGVTLGAAGVLTVRDDAVVGGTVVTDRLGPAQTVAPAAVTAEQSPFGDLRLAGILHPEAQALLEVFARDGVRPYDELSVLQARAAVGAATRLQGPRRDVELVRDLLVDLSPGRMPVRLYHPEPTRVLPVVVYLHGGGFVAGSVAAADRPCRALALAAGCAILSVEYRLAPESPFPTPVLDCLAAIRWTVEHAPELGLDPARMIVMGDSAGGCLAAACSLALCDAGDSPLIAQILVYPTLRPVRGNPSLSLQTNGEGYSMTRGSLEWFWDHYLQQPEDAEDPLAAPLLAADLSGLPPATVVLAEFDPLRDEGLEYARRLQDAGVPVQVHLVPGALHGFWWMDKVLSQADELTESLAADLRHRFAVQ